MTKNELIEKLNGGMSVADALDLQRADGGELYYLDYDAWDYEPLDTFDETTGILCILPNDLMQKRELSGEEIEILEGHIFSKGEVLRITHCNVEAALYLLETLPYDLDVERLQNPMEEDEDRFQESYESLIARPADKFSPLEYIRAMLCSMDAYGYLLQEERGVKTAIRPNRAVYANGISVQCIVGSKLFEYNPLEAYRSYLCSESLRLEESVGEAIRPLLTDAAGVICETEGIDIDPSKENLAEYVHLVDSRRRNLTEAERRYLDYEDTVRAASVIAADFLDRFYRLYRLTAGSYLRPILAHHEDEIFLEIAFSGQVIRVDTQKYYGIDRSYAEMALAILDDLISKAIPVLEAKGLVGDAVRDLMRDAVADSWINQE